MLDSLHGPPCWVALVVFRAIVSNRRLMGIIALVAQLNDICRLLDKLAIKYHNGTNQRGLFNIFGKSVIIWFDLTIVVMNLRGYGK